MLCKESLKEKPDGVIAERQKRDSIESGFMWILKICRRTTD